MQVVKALAWDRIAQPKLRAIGLESLAAIRSMYRRFSPNRLVISRKTLPANANLPLLHCWKQLAVNRIPMLVLRSPNSTPKPGEFDYLAFLRRDSTASECVPRSICAMEKPPLESTAEVSGLPSRNNTIMSAVLGGGSKRACPVTL